MIIMLSWPLLPLAIRQNKRVTIDKRCYVVVKAVGPRWLLSWLPLSAFAAVFTNTMRKALPICSLYVFYQRLLHIYDLSWPIYDTLIVPKKSSDILKTKSFLGRLSLRSTSLPSKSSRRSTGRRCPRSGLQLVSIIVGRRPSNLQTWSTSHWKTAG